MSEYQNIVSELTFSSQCIYLSRETRDGCDGCPGPIGKERNRTAEAILGQNQPNRDR